MYYDPKTDWRPYVKTLEIRFDRRCGRFDAENVQDKLKRREFRADPDRALCVSARLILVGATTVMWNDRACLIDQSWLWQSFVRQPV